MTAYGNFEAIAQVFKTHHGSIWSARTAGTDESPDCSIKLLELNQAMLDQRDTTLAQNLLVSAALQQAMGNKSEFWAPVYGLGSQGTNAFYASRLFPKSLQTLIDHQTPLTSAELKTIILGIIDGLMDLNTAFHRTHSNLKPSNVLLDDATKIRDGSIFLCDPDPSTEDVASLTRTPDTKAIGEIIYALVTHRPHSTARWPLPKSEKWNELGTTGRQWRSVCENLLNTVSRRGLPALEHLRNQIESIRPTRRRTPRAVFAMLALVAVAGAGYVKRDRLPGWYRQARAEVASLIPAKTRKNRPRAFATTAATQGVQQIASNLKPPIFPSSQPMIATDSIKPIVPPIPHVADATTAALRVDPQVLKAIHRAYSPEFHSDAAKAEFIRQRNQYASAHAESASESLLSDWHQILSRCGELDSEYPQLDPANTAGWPTGVAAVLNARRDAMLQQAIDSAFLQQPADPSSFQITVKRVQTAANAVVAAHDALARGDIKGSENAISICKGSLDSFSTGDADLAELFGPVKKEFGALEDISAIKDRTALLDIADNDGASLAVRLAAWLHAGSISTDPWPVEIPQLADEQSRAARIYTALLEVGSVDIAKQVADTEADRQNGFYSRLRDQDSVLTAVKVASDPHYAPLLAKSPIWFRYDAALYVLRCTPAAEVTAEQKKTFTDLAAQVNPSAIQLVHNAFISKADPPPPLSQCGPGSVKGWQGWQLQSGSTADHCTYLCANTGDTLEFLRVHVPDDPDGVDCYLCTTAVPLALMQNLLRGNAAALNAAESLNTPPSPIGKGMRLWSFNDKSVAVDIDEDDYRKCFGVSPSDQLPVQFVTPQTAFYLARKVGCRLPTSREWTAALMQARQSTDSNMKGFATTGWKLRDHEFAKLLTIPDRDAEYWPDDYIFLGNLDPSTIKRQAGADIWTAPALAALGGSSASDATTSPALLQLSAGSGFRPVDDSQNIGGVFHDLIGNVAQYVMDVPVVLSEKVSVSPPLRSEDVVHAVNEFFSPSQMAAVSVIGGSALSPPQIVPTKPYPLPRNANQFADVGFRLAFTDPVSLVNAQHALLSEAAYLTAP